MAALDIGVYGARGIPSTYSGYETFLTVLLPELARRGHRVTMYCRLGATPDRGVYRGVRRVMLPAPSSKQLETLSHGLLASLGARVAGHDVVFVVNVANAGYCLLAGLTGQRTVLNTDGLEWERGKWGSAARRFFKLSARIAGRAASALVADSAAMAAIYAREFGAPSTVIPYCWTGLPELDEPPGGIASPGRYFVIGGRLNPENNLARVAEAYAASGAATPLLVLGTANYDSPERHRLEAVASTGAGVRMVGHVGDRAAYAALLRGARAYLHAHSVGGINPSLIEAMGCGARILALGTPFNREALADAGGYFDDFAEELPELFRRLEQPSPDDSELRARAAERARTVFGLDAVAGAHEALFAAVAAAPARGQTRIDTPWSQTASAGAVGS